MFVVYSWETFHSMQIVYVGSDGVTKDVREAFQFDTYEAAVNYKETIDVVLTNSVSRQWFIGEIVPACRGYLGEFGENVKKMGKQ